jgi:purine catabolism regulator
VAPIIVGEIARGYLSLVGLSGELDALDHLVAEQGSSVCAVEMARNKAIREAEKRLKGDLLTALLQDILSPRDARLWVQSMGLDLSQAHVALRFAWDGPAPPSRRRLETLVNGEITRLGLLAIVSPMEAEVICFCQVSPEVKRPEAAMTLGQAVLEQSRRENPDVRGRCGVGAVAQALEEWLTSLRQAGQALEMARRLGEQNPLYYADLSVYRLLMQLEHSPELVSFQEETIGPLLAGDGDRELIHTLEVYFTNHGNLAKTAEALYIHRNTLIYRMGRIEAITNLDLDNPENRLAIQLALRIYRMTRKPAG